jgi:hypothetical protein
VTSLSFIEALDQALELLEQGYPFEYCVQQFPEHSDRLRPLLQVGDDLRRLAQAPAPQLDPSKTTPDWNKLLADVPQCRSRRSRVVADLHSWINFNLLPNKRLFVGLATAFLLIFGAGLHGTVNSPDNQFLDPLNPLVKRLQLATAVFNPVEQSEWHITYAQRYLDQASILARQTGYIPAGVLAQVVVEVEQAVSTAKQTNKQVQLFSQISALIVEAEDLVTQAKVETTTPQWKRIDRVSAQLKQLQNDLQASAASSDRPTPKLSISVENATPTSTHVALSIKPGTKRESKSTKNNDKQIIPTNLSTTPLETLSETPTSLPLASAPSSPMDDPTIEPEAPPTAEPTPVPTAEPTPVPTAEPTPVPTAEPTPVPTAEPTPVPTAEPTPVPTAEPTPVPTAEPTARSANEVPTEPPTVEPTEESTAVPTAEPTSESANEVLPLPTAQPEPTFEPTPVLVEPTADSAESLSIPDSAPAIGNEAFAPQQESTSIVGTDSTVEQTPKPENRSGPASSAPAEGNEQKKKADDNAPRGQEAAPKQP